jgi:hypothetical protein
VRRGYVPWPDLTSCMIAGYDMTGLALSWFFYFLTKSSFVVTKIIFLFYERLICLSCMITLKRH